MRTYELMFVVDPRVSDEDVVTMTNDYKNLITAAGSQITSEENWGRRKLAYPIEKVHKAHYVLMNIECDNETLAELEHSFKFSDAVLRHLIIKMPKAHTAPSPMMKEEKSKSMMGAGGRSEARPGEAPAEPARAERPAA